MTQTSKYVFQPSLNLWPTHMMYILTLLGPGGSHKDENTTKSNKPEANFIPETRSQEKTEANLKIKKLKLKKNEQNRHGAQKLIS